jgi:chromosome segregation ATPase
MATSVDLRIELDRAHTKVADATLKLLSVDGQTTETKQEIDRLTAKKEALASRLAGGEDVAAALSFCGNDLHDAQENLALRLVPLRQATVQELEATKQELADAQAAWKETQ